MPSEDAPHKYRAAYQAKNSDKTLYSPSLPMAGAQKTAQGLQESGFAVEGVVTEEQFLERTGSFFVRWISAGEQRDSGIMPSRDDAIRFTEDLEEDQFNTDMEILPARLHPVRMRQAEALFPEEPTPEQYDALERALEPEPLADDVDDFEASGTSVGMADAAYSGRSTRFQAVEWALRLAELRKKMGDAMIETADVVKDAQQFAAFLDGTTAE